MSPAWGARAGNVVRERMGAQRGSEAAPRNARSLGNHSGGHPLLGVKKSIAGHEEWVTKLPHYRNGPASSRRNGGAVRTATAPVASHPHTGVHPHGGTCPACSFVVGVVVVRPAAGEPDDARKPGATRVHHRHDGPCCTAGYKQS